MKVSGDNFSKAGKGSSDPLSSIFQPQEDRWSDRVLYFFQALLAIDIPDVKQSTVLTKSRAFGEATDAPVNVTQPNQSWTLIGTLKAFAVLFVDYQAKLTGILADTSAIKVDTTAIVDEATAIKLALLDLNAKVDTLATALAAIESTTDVINTGVTAVISEIQDVDAGLTNLNATASSIRTRMDAPFNTI